MKRLFTLLFFVVSCSFGFCQNSDDFVEIKINRLEYKNGFLPRHLNFALIDVAFPFGEEYWYLSLNEGKGYLADAKFGTYVGYNIYAVASVGFTHLTEDLSYLEDSGFSLFDLGIGLRYILIQKKKINISADVMGQFSVVNRDQSLRIFGLNFQPKIGYEFQKNWELNCSLFYRRSFFDFQRFEKGIGLGILRNL